MRGAKNELSDQIRLSLGRFRVVSIERKELVSFRPLRSILAVQRRTLMKLQRALLQRHGSSHEALNNGTHFWEKTVILFSIDGLKPSYLTPEQLPNLHRLSSIDDAQTLFGPSMWPVSPSLTFPNHWTLMTGLEPSSHGIVANDFLDIGKNKTFYYTDPARSWDASWWKGVPLWEAVQRQGRRSANLMWPGPPKTTRGASPDFFQEYESPRDWPMERRLAHLLRWIDLPSNQRPSFICGYAPDIDSLTHSHGVNISHPSITKALLSIDELLPSLLSAIALRNATELVDIILVSDHGMTSTSNDRLLFLDDILGPALFPRIRSRHAWPNVELRFESADDEDEARAALLRAREKHRTFDVLDRPQLVEHFNWSADAADLRDRVGNLWALPDVGYSFTTHEEMRSFEDGVYSPRG
ncbi:hypothetical protein L7F22_044597 [Adiantum nelumboides]|nr:hypothetical protein [Adiantum nelumboides]